MRWGSGLLALVMLIAIGSYAYRHASRLHQMASASRKVAVPDAPPAPISGSRCDGRTYCSQMTSCAEATYFLQNCPGTQMDGNGDGVPCEKQWCH